MTTEPFFTTDQVLNQAFDHRDRRLKVESGAEEEFGRIATVFANGRLSRVDYFRDEAGLELSHSLNLFYEDDGTFSYLTRTYPA